MLAGLVEDEFITQDEAIAVMQMYDRGEISEEDLPRPLERAVVQDLVGEPMTVEEAQAASDEFRREAETFVSFLLLRWHIEMRSLILRDMRRRAAGGLNGASPSTLPDDVTQEANRQLAFLQRFAEERAITDILERGDSMSEDQVASRAALYGGAGYGMYWLGRTMSEERSDMVVRYVAVDDGNTCPECSSAAMNGPYLPTQGFPVPGLNCLGGSRCRCYLEHVYAPEIAATL